MREELANQTLYNKYGFIRLPQAIRSNPDFPFKAGDRLEVFIRKDGLLLKVTRQAVEANSSPNQLQLQSNSQVD